MSEEIIRHEVDEGRNFDDEELEGGKYVEEVEDELLEEKIKKARERKKARPKIWRPSPGQERAVRIEKIEEKESEFGKMKVLFLWDLEEKQLYSLIGCGFLLKSLEAGKLKLGRSYLLQYEGKVQISVDGGGDREVHSWSFEEVK